MSRLLHQIIVFVSGPSGVDAEKAALRVATDEISRRSEKTHAVSLRVVSWPDDFRPGVDDDPQLAIEHQLVPYDIYVGILGTRFGTPTSRSGSGTQEEFEQALARYKEDPTAIRVLFYFKHEVEDPFLLDLEQLRRVREFRDGLGKKGVLFAEFRNTAEFTDLVRRHLDSLIIDDWRDGKWAQNADNTPTELIAGHIQGALDESAEASDSDDCDLGLFDYFAAFQNASEAIVRVMERISEHTERVGNDVRARTEESDEIVRQQAQSGTVGGSRTQQHLVAAARDTVNRAAQNLDDFSNAMAADVKEYRFHNRAMFDNLRLAFREGTELGRTDHQEDRTGLVQLIPVIQESRDHVMTFQATVDRVPALTGRFKRSRRRAAAILGEMVAEMSFSLQEAQALLDELDRAGTPEDRT